MGGERRYTEKEFALILRKAAELQEGGRETHASALTLEEIGQVAAEAGIDPHFVELAARQIPALHERRGHALVGAPWRWEYGHLVDGEVPEQEMGRLVDAIRSVMLKPGEVGEVFGALEWRWNDDLGPVLVRITPRAGKTTVQVTGDRGTESGLILGLGAVTGGFVGAALMAAGLGLEGASEVVPALFASGGLSYMGGRALWRHMSSRWERRLRGLADRLREVVEASGRRP